MFVRKLTDVQIGAGWRSFAWTIILVRLCLPIMPTSAIAVSLFADVGSELAIVSEAETSGPLKTVRNFEFAADPIVVIGGKGENFQESTMPVADQGKSTIKAQLMQLDLNHWLITLYLSGLAISFLGLIRRMIKLKGLNRSLVELTDGPQAILFKNTLKELKIRRAIPLYMDPKASTPYLSGIISPKVVLSLDSCRQMTMDQQKMIFIHELIHYKRKDVLRLWLLEVLACLHWYNLVLLWTRNTIRQDFELACDEEVLRKIDSSSHHLYSQVLALIAIKTFIKRPGALTAHMADKKGKKLKERLKMIKYFNKKRRPFIGMALIMVLTLMLVACTTTPASKMDNAENETSTSVEITASNDTYTTDGENELSVTGESTGTDNTNGEKGTNPVYLETLTMDEAIAIIGRMDNLHFLSDLDGVTDVPVYSRQYYFDEAMLSAEEFDEVVQQKLVFPIKDSGKALVVNSQYGEVHDLAILDYDGGFLDPLKNDFTLSVNTEPILMITEALTEEVFKPYIGLEIDQFRSGFGINNDLVALRAGDKGIHFYRIQANGGEMGLYIYEFQGKITNIVLNNEANFEIVKIPEMLASQATLPDVTVEAMVNAENNYLTIAKEVMVDYFGESIEVSSLSKDRIVDFGYFNDIQVSDGFGYYISKEDQSIFFVYRYPRDITPLEIRLTEEASREKVETFIGNSFALKDLDLVFYESTFELVFDSSDVEFYVFEYRNAEEVVYLKIATDSGSVVEITREAL